MKVLEVDLQRKRVALTMRLEEAAPRAAPNVQSRDSGGRPGDRTNDRGPQQPQRQPVRPQQREAAPQGNGMMAEALMRALKK